MNAEHDDQCEKLPNFYLCHCAKRERLARGVTELPTLQMSYPICGGCGHETWHDGDSLRCDRCHVTWGSNAGDGDWASRFWDDYDSDHDSLDSMRAAWLERYPQEVTS